MKRLFLLLSAFGNIKSKLGVGTIIKSHLGRGAFLHMTSRKLFPMKFAIIITVVVTLYKLVHLTNLNEISNSIFQLIECSDDKSHLPVNLNISGLISINVGEALLAGGIGFGAAKMVQACPPQTRLAATIGLGSIIGATYLAKNAIQVLNSTTTGNKPSAFDNSNPEGPLSKPVQTDTVKEDSIININSVLEMDWFDTLSPEMVLLYCCLIFTGLSLYFFIGLIISVLARNFLNTSPLVKRLEEKLHKWDTAGVLLARIGKLLSFWLKESNRITSFIMSFIILYSLMANIVILLFLINFKG